MPPTFTEIEFLEPAGELISLCAPEHSTEKRKKLAKVSKSMKAMKQTVLFFYQQIYKE